MAVRLEILDRFDPKTWQTAPPLPVPRQTFLLTWNESPPAVDAGIPEDAARILSQALCSLGPVLFAGDRESKDPGATRTITLRRRFRQFTLLVYCAAASPDLLPAFTSATHSWSINAQWLLVVDSPEAAEGLDELIRRLYQDWSIPDVWPPAVLVLVQAAVDGDGAACHCANAAVRNQLRTAIQEYARRAGIEISLPASV